MHEAVFGCLIAREEGASFSLFLSYRTVSDAPLARLLFDELHHRWRRVELKLAPGRSPLTRPRPPGPMCRSVTPHGHRVAVHWDQRRAIKGDEWDGAIVRGLLHSLVVMPLLSYGATAPLACMPHDMAAVPGLGWAEEPVGFSRLRGKESDREDAVLKVSGIAPRPPTPGFLFFVVLLFFFTPSPPLPSPHHPTRRFLFCFFSILSYLSPLSFFPRPHRPKAPPSSPVPPHHPHTCFPYLHLCLPSLSPLAYTPMRVA